AMHSSIPMKAAYKPLSNKYFNWLAVKSRTRLKIFLIPKRQLLKHLTDHANEQTLLVLIADQSPNPKEHFWVNFLNQPTAVVTGMEKLACKYNYVVFYATINWIKRGKYEITYKLLTDDPNSLPPKKLTELFMKELEQDILRNPAPYLWSHRRWKLKKPAEIII
ncbi:MAG: lysophospholipid acyltransferase family protein, partial [Chitinophagales bacterium]